MKKNLVLTLSVLACATLPGLATAADSEPLTASSRAAVKELFSALKGELETAMKDGGPVKAIEVCNKKAVEIAREQGAKYGGSVARTSLKARNAKNAPDAWERKVLEYFDARNAAGADPQKLEYSEVVTVDGKQTFRYMKAIPTADVCAKCHGTEIDPKVTAKLDALYPKDPARGYKAGDLRGAFTLKKAL